jgi:hypothetical protein
MDFLNRNGQPAQQGRPANQGGNPVRTDINSSQNNGMHEPAMNHGGHDASEHHRKHFGWGNLPGWLRIAHIILLFSITVLMVGVVLSLRQTNPDEKQYVATDKYQAVFLENGQVYFGKVAALNSNFINLQNVFYLNSQTQSEEAKTTDQNQFTLIKLGCELHGPYDRMIVNRDQVTFWENLKDDGQVVKTINEWIKQNPNGQKCETSTNTTEQSTGNTQSPTGASTSTTGTNKQN